MPDTAQSGGSNGFFSNLVNSAQTGLNTILTDVAPRWAASQLGVQQTSQLNQDTRGSNQPNNLSTSTVVSKSPMVALILLGGGALLTVLILKKA